METRIPYKPSTLFLLFITLCFGLCAAFSGYIAITSQSGVSLFKWIALDGPHAAMMYTAISSLCFIFMAIGLVLFFLKGSIKKDIIFTDNELQFPKKGLNNDYIHIPYVEIVHTSEVKVNSTNIFSVDHQHGEISLHSTMVPGREYYEKFKSELVHRVYG